MVIWTLVILISEHLMLWLDSTLNIYNLFQSISTLATLWWRIFLYRYGAEASGSPLFLPALSNDPHAGQGWTEEPWFLLACQRNVTASSVQGQTGEYSLQLSITPGAGRETHGELSALSFIYLLFHCLYLSCSLIFFRSLHYSGAFPSSFSLHRDPPFMSALSASVRYSQILHIHVDPPQTIPHACFVVAHCLRQYPT